MRATILLSFIFLFCVEFCNGQKPLVTLDTYKSWSYAGNGDISSDGKFALYIGNFPEEPKKVLYVKATSGKLIYSKPGVDLAKFSADGNYVVSSFGDTLSIYKLSKKKHVQITGVSSFELGIWGNTEHIFTRSRERDLEIFDFEGRKVFRLSRLNEYKILHEEMKMIAIQEDSLTKNLILVWCDAKTGQKETAYSGPNISNLIVDKKGTQLAFILSGQENKIGYYKPGMKTAEILDVKSDLQLSTDQYLSFSSDGKRLLFYLSDNRNTAKVSSSLNLDVWSYQDRFLPTYYYGRSDLGSNIKPDYYLASLDLGTKVTMQLTKDDQKIINGTLVPQTDSFCIVESNAPIRSGKWPNGIGRNYFLCITATGELIPLKENETIPLYLWHISPLGKYIVYYDYQSKGYLCYEIATRQRRKVTNGLKDLSRYDKQYYAVPESYPAGVCNWLKNDEGLIIQGTYDLWLVDPSGAKPAKNITHGLGNRDRIIFTPAFATDVVEDGTGQILLSAFDTHSKDYGFYTANINTDNEPQKISMGPRYMIETYQSIAASKLMKAKGGYLVQFEESNCSPNYYFSKDLKTFKAISDIRPELRWNWLKAELHSYKDSRENELQGILYKPSNFDPNKKYPVLFGVYELQTHHLNTYTPPYLAGAMFSIPYMVSNGYLVFLPDVKGSPRYGGEALTRCIVAGADHLSNFSWVDTARMGIAGHSVGGFVTNYAITHCNRFKAAISGAGISNMITAATDLWGDGPAKQEYLKDAVYMMDVGLLEDLDTYIRNSPVLAAQNLKTPVMLLHNDRDGSVRYEQSRSFFIILRELQKPAWWLNYIGKDHHVTGDQQRIDYNIKVKEFFDHYLKCAPMPDWMREHI